MRLTKYSKNKHIPFIRDKEMSLIYRIRHYQSRCYGGKAIDKLAAYEDIGTPEELHTMKTNFKFYESMAEQCSEQFNKQYDEFAAYQQAEEEGRILPKCEDCKSYHKITYGDNSDCDNCTVIEFNHPQQGMRNYFKPRDKESEE